MKTMEESGDDGPENGVTILHMARYAEERITENAAKTPFDNQSAQG